MKTTMKSVVAALAAVVGLTTWATSLTVESRPNTVKGVWVTKSENNPPSEKDYSNTDKSEVKVLWPQNFWAYYKTSTEEWDFLGWFDNEAGSGTALSTDWPYKYSVEAGNDVTIYGHFHVHDFSLYETNGLTITRKCADTTGKCTHGYTVKSATLVAADSKICDGTAYAATKTGSGADDATIAYWKGESQIDEAVEAGDYKVTMTYGTGTVSKAFSIVEHKHDFECDNTDGKLTVTCLNAGCTIPGGTSLEIVCENQGLTYDGKTALTATIRDNTPSPDTFESYTGGTRDANVTWDDSSVNAGDHKATFKATVAGVEYTISKTFTIKTKDIDGAAVTLSATSLPYTGTDQTVTISSVKIGDLDVAYDQDDESEHTAKNIGTHTIKINGKGNFSGTATKDWQITNYSGTLKGLTAAETDIGKLEGTTLTVTNSTKFTYDANCNVWYAGLTLTWEATTKDYTITEYGYAIFTKPELAQMTIGDKTYTGNQSEVFKGGKIDNIQSTLTYKKNIGNEKSCTYLKTTTWYVMVTPQIIEDAKTAGAITGTMYAGALPFSESDDTQRSQGIEFKTYTIKIPIDDSLKLFDDVGNQVYPDAGYVAQIAETKVKYTNLCEAVKAATAGQTINALASCEAGTFSLATNVTLNLLKYGANGAEYKLVADDANKAAKVTSSNGTETVTTDVSGFRIVKTSASDLYTYAIDREHYHLWKTENVDATLTASCTNEVGECDIPDGKTSITLTVTGGSDGVAPTFAISNKVDFLAKVNKYAEVTKIGDVKVKRETNDGAETTKWYIGDYTASCTVTVNGEEKTITQDFSIKGPYKDGGYVVASCSIRYDSFDEAIVAAEAGDTVYYRDGTLSDQSVSFNVTKDVTIDFNNAEFYYKGNSDASFSNVGSGTLTLKNIQLKQPRYSPTMGSRKYHNITLGGKLILSDGVKGVETDDDEDDKLSFNVINGSVEVQSNGLYQAAFAAGENGSVSITGGEFWQYFNPADTTYVDYEHVTVAATTEGYKYKVVPHEHDYYYVSEGNVITMKCRGAGYEGCFCMLTPQKLTLTATNCLEGATYAGASYKHDDKFLYDDPDPVIKYYANDVELTSAPSTFGDYEARVAVKWGEATGTAVAAFKITHAHKFRFDVAPAETLTATCTNKASACDVPENKTNVTLKVTGGGDGVAPTFTIENRDAFLAIVNRDAQIASIGEITTVRTTDDGAETTKWYVGDYRSTCVVTADGVEYVLTNEFKISKTAEYTKGWTVGTRDIRYDTWDEALAAAQDGDTIFYRDGDRDFKTHEFSIGEKNLTINFAGATLTKDEYTDMTIKNSGTATLIFQNVTIKQPRGWGNSGQIKAEGNIVFGADVKVVNTATSESNYCTITVNSGTLIVSNGLYQCGFAIDGGEVGIAGGKYWEHDDPSAFVVEGCLVREIAGDYKYEVVVHEHLLTYQVAGNVVTLVCTGLVAASDCPYNKNPQTLTLVVEDAAWTGAAYAGASTNVTDSFADGGAAVGPIEYWLDGVKLDEAPTAESNYVAKVTVTFGNDETVTAEKAFKITHAHLFKFDVTAGDTLAATCTNEVSACDVPDRTTAITLKVTDNGDGNAPTFTIENKDAFLGFVNRDATIVTIGEITAVRTTDDGAETTKWYLGNYTASCTVTANGENLTITNAFAIGGEYKSGGYAVASRGIRYDSFAEAVSAAKDGDTIHYRNGDLDQRQIKFAATKDVTLDCGGATFAYTDDDGDMEIYNNGAGTLTLQNVRISQPVYDPFIGSKKYHNVSLNGGNFVLGVNVAFLQGTSDFTVNVMSISVAVTNGLYQCAFAENGTADVEISGGVYQYDDHCKPQESMLKEDHIIVAKTVEQINYYEVVPHAHLFAYEAADNVVTLVCTGLANAVDCSYNKQPQTLTLVAEDAAWTGEPYAGATTNVTDKFADGGAAVGPIEYWLDGKKLEGAPTDMSNYVATVTVMFGNDESVTASNAFAITHTHLWKYTAEGATVTAECTNGTCTVAENPTATLSVVSQTNYTGSVIEPAAFVKGSDFEGDAVIGYEPASPKNVGTYKVFAKIGDAVASNEFEIVAADMAGVTASMETAEFDFAAAEIFNDKIGSATFGGYSLTSADYTVSGTTNAFGSAYSNVTCTVTLTGQGNFTGTKEVTWIIKAPTGSFESSGKISGVGGIYEGTTLTLTNGCDYVYSDGKWTAGVTAEYPVGTWKFFMPRHAVFYANGEMFFGTELPKHGISAETGHVSCDYMKSFTYETGFTAVQLEEAAGTDLTNSVSACALVWEEGLYGHGSGIRGTDFHVVAKTADITLPLPNNETCDLGETVLSNVRIDLAPGAKVTSAVEQTVGRIFTTTPEYKITETVESGIHTFVCVKGEDDDKKIVIRDDDDDDPEDVEKDGSVTLIVESDRTKDVEAGNLVSSNSNVIIVNEATNELTVGSVVAGGDVIVTNRTEAGVIAALGEIESSNDVLIVNNGHLNADVSAEGDITIFNGSVHTLVGKYVAKGSLAIDGGVGAALGDVTLSADKALTLTGTNVITGSVSMFGGAVTNTGHTVFSVADGNAGWLNDFDLIATNDAEIATFGIEIDEVQATGATVGTYALAGNASSAAGAVFELKGGSVDADITVGGGTLQIGNKKFTLALSGDELRLTIAIQQDPGPTPPGPTPEPEPEPEPEPTPTPAAISELKQQLGSRGDVVYGADGSGNVTNVLITMKDDFLGTLNIPGDLLFVTIDLDGYSIIGDDGVSTNVDGKCAIEVEDGSWLRLVGVGLVKGGDGFDGVDSAKGAKAIQPDDVVLYKGDFVRVVDGLDSCGGYVTFTTNEVATVEGEVFEVGVSGGSSERSTSVTLTFAKGTYTAATTAYVDGKKAKFPLTLDWARGEVSEKTVSIVTKKTTKVDEDRFFTLQLSGPAGAEMGEIPVMTVTVEDAKQPTESETAYARAIAWPAHAGTVSGAGTLNTAKSSRTLKAKAKSGVGTFAGWYLPMTNDVNQIDTNALVSTSASLKVGYGTEFGDGTYYAYFTDVLPVASVIDPDEKAETAEGVTFADGVYVFQVARYAQIPVGIDDDSLRGSLAVSGLPSGLKYNRKTGFICGTPTKASVGKTFKVVAKNAAGRQTVVYEYEVEALPANAVGTWNGLVRQLEDPEDGAHAGFGTVQFSATSSGKLSAKVTTRLTGTKSFSTTGYSLVDENVYAVTMTAKAGEVFSATLYLTNDWKTAQLVGTVTGGALAANGEEVKFAAIRNAFVKSDKNQEALNFLSAYKGTYAATLVPANDGAASGTVTFKVQDGGKVQLKAKTSLGSYSATCAGAFRALPDGALGGQGLTALPSDSAAVQAAIRCGKRLLATDTVLGSDDTVEGLACEYDESGDDAHMRVTAGN